MKLITLLVIIFPVVCFAQTDSIVYYSAVVKVDSAKKEDLFIRARQWFNASFKDARNVIRVADKETGEILSKGIVQSYHWYRSLGTESKIPISYHADICIYVKDGRYKYEFKNFIDTDQTPAAAIYHGPLLFTKEYPGKGYRKKEIMDKIWISQQEELSITIEELVKGLHDYMSRPTNDF